MLVDERYRPQQASLSNRTHVGDLSRALDLVAAVAHRDAAPQDIVAELRKNGFDSLDVVVAALARAAEQPADRRRAERPVDVRRFSQPTPRELVEKIEHRAPKIPFVLNGTLYDPEDVCRFNGHELHFVVGSRGNELLVFDDRNVIARVWELTYVASLSGALGVYRPSDVARQDMGPPQLRDGPEVFPGPRFIAWPPVGDPGAYFYEDSGPDGWGGSLYLRPNRGYPDLRRVGLGLFGDWNDAISAFRGHGVQTVVLHEHINWTGNSLTHYAESSMDYLGWNDRASSVETW